MALGFDPLSANPLSGLEAVAAGGAKTVTADAGTYAVTGSTATLKRGLKVAADAGSYAVTGSNASLLRGYKIAAAVGSYAVTGSNATLSQPHRQITATAGSYAVTGTAASLKIGYKVTVVAGAYAVTGTDASLKRGYKVAAGAGSYAVTGTDASLKLGRKITALAGSYVVTGTDASLEYGYKLTAVAGSYTVTGTDATLTKTTAGTKTLAADAGSYLVTGTDVSLTLVSAVVVTAETATPGRVRHYPSRRDPREVAEEQRKSRIAALRDAYTFAHKASAHLSTQTLKALRRALERGLEPNERYDGLPELDRVDWAWLSFLPGDADRLLSLLADAGDEAEVGLAREALRLRKAPVKLEKLSRKAEKLPKGTLSEEIPEPPIGPIPGPLDVENEIAAAEAFRLAQEAARTQRQDDEDAIAMLLLAA